MTNPNEPTLTCSEVVERLARECLRYRYDEGAKLDKFLAIKILTEWRERRVQEPSGSEICRRQAEYFAQLMESAKRSHNFSAFTLNEERKRVCEELAETIERAADEWREQVGKGAKHE
jgi:hypothetical protein